MFLFLSEETLLKNCHQVTLEVYIDIVRHRLSPAPVTFTEALPVPLLVESGMCC